MQVKVKKLDEKAIIPKAVDIGSAGLDLVAVSEKFFADGAINYVEYGTGLAMEIPEGHVGLLFPRSSVSSNTTLLLANSVGVIDNSYRGEIKLRFKSIVPSGAKKYKVGEKVGQLVIIPYPKIELVESENLSETSRGAGGFGSSDKK